MNAPDIDPGQPRSPKSRRGMILVATVIATATIGAAAVYGIAPLLRKEAGDPVCRPALATARALEPLARGEVAAVTMAKSPLKVPDLAFSDADGRGRRLSDFRGHTVLLNLWATWCVPCRKEMPALDALQAKLGGKDFEVLAINIDTRDPEKPKAFLRDGGLARLGYFHDPSARVFQELKAAGRALGMPTSMLIDANGCEIGTIAGPAEWASEDAVRMISAALSPAR